MKTKMRKTAILVDEMNAMVQFHRLGIEGIRPWRQFYKTVETYFASNQAPAEYHMFGCNVPKGLDEERFELRERFFSALFRDGINVHKGFTVLDQQNKLVSKGVDVLLSLNLVDLSFEGYDEIFVFSANSDIVPAIQRARENGAVVKAILSSNVPAGRMAKAVDEIIRLEDIIRLIPSKHLPRREIKSKTNFKESA